jgi:mono/diheme cytochrome c family protein
MKLFALCAALGSLLVFHFTESLARPQTPSAQEIARGKYLVEITGCNDCHTAGYAESGGKTAEAEWLKGDALGYRGPWGTTYPTNLRISMGKLTEAQWMKYAKSLMTRPPMPWFNVRAMNDADLRSIYIYVKQLGTSGQAAPAFLPPGQAAKGPFIQWPMPK